MCRDNAVLWRTNISEKTNPNIDNDIWHIDFKDLDYNVELTWIPTNPQITWLQSCSLVAFQRCNWASCIVYIQAIPFENAIPKCNDIYPQSATKLVKTTYPKRPFWRLPTSKGKNEAFLYPPLQVMLYPSERYPYKKQLEKRVEEYRTILAFFIINTWLITEMVRNISHRALHFYVQDYLRQNNRYNLVICQFP